MKTLSIILGIVLYAHSFEFDKVVAVHDGDTITVLSSDNVEKKIRLEGIDCPELNQSFGMKAKMFVSQLCYRKRVRIEIKGKDRYGRYLAWIFTEDGSCVNLLLVENGLAWHYKKYSKDAKLKDAEIKARKLKLNIWSEKNPIAPWEFRHFKRK